MSRVKPNLGAPRIEPVVLPENVRTRLMLHLAGSRLNNAQRIAFINHCAFLAALPCDPTPQALQRDQLQKVAADARRLLVAVRGMSEDARALVAMHVREMNAEPLHVGDDEGNHFLPAAWDLLDALERAAEQACRDMEIDRQTKPAQHRAKGLVAAMARYLERSVDVTPPMDPASWFYGFSECFCEHLELRIGADLVRGAVKNTVG